MEADREDVKADEYFAIAPVPRHLAVTILPSMVVALLTQFAIVSEEFIISKPVAAFIAELRKENRTDLGETIEAALDNIMEAAS